MSSRQATCEPPHAEYTARTVSNDAVLHVLKVTAALPQSWYETPNIHFCTIADFEQLCRDMGAVIERRVSVDAFGRRERIEAPGALANLFAEQGMFLLRNKG